MADSASPDTPDLVVPDTADQSNNYHTTQEKLQNVAIDISQRGDDSNNVCATPHDKMDSSMESKPHERMDTLGAAGDSRCANEQPYPAQKETVENNHCALKMDDDTACKSNICDVSKSRAQESANEGPVSQSHDDNSIAADTVSDQTHSQQTELDRDLRHDLSIKNDNKSEKQSDDLCSDSPEQLNDSDCAKQVEDDLSLGQLKKDDSGIVLEKSPVKDSSGLDDSELTSNTEVMFTENAEAKEDDGNLSTQTSSRLRLESEGLVADFVDTEDSEIAETCDLLKRDVAMSDSDDDTAEPLSSAATKRPRPVDRDSDDTDTEEEHTDNTDDDTKCDKSEEEDMEVDLEPPRDAWRPLWEVRQREIGYSNAMPVSYLFRSRAGGSVHLARRLKLQQKLDHHEGCVNALHFNRTGTLLASGSDDLNIVVWNWVSGAPFLVFDSGHRSNVFQSKFMPYAGDTHIVSCARDGQIRLAELSSTGRCKGTKKLTQHRGAAHKLALLHDSSHVFYSCGEDAVTFEIDLRQDKPNKLCTTKENDRKVPLYSIHSNPFKSHEYCVGGRDHFIRVYDKRMLNGSEGGPTVKKYCPHHLINSEIKANVTCAVYNYNGTEIMGTYNDEDIYLFSNEHSDGAEHIHRYQGHRNNATVKGINFYGPRSEFIVSGSDCGNVFLWEKESEKIVNYFHADEGGVINVLEPHPHSPVLATSGLDHDVKIWAPTADEPTNLEGLRKVIKRNRKDRQDERVNEPDMIDSSMLWFLMHHLRRTARRRARDDGEEVSSTSSDTEEESEDSEDTQEPMQCVPS